MYLQIHLTFYDQGFYFTNIYFVANGYSTKFARNFLKVYLNSEIVHRKRKYMYSARVKQTENYSSKQRNLENEMKNSGK